MFHVSCPMLGLTGPQRGPYYTSLHEDRSYVNKDIRCTSDSPRSLPAFRKRKMIFNKYFKKFARVDPRRRREKCSAFLWWKNRRGGRGVCERMDNLTADDTHQKAMILSYRMPTDEKYFRSRTGAKLFRVIDFMLIFVKVS